MHREDKLHDPEPLPRRNSSLDRHQVSRCEAPVTALGLVARHAAAPAQQLPGPREVCPLAELPGRCSIFLPAEVGEVQNGLGGPQAAHGLASHVVALEHLVSVLHRNAQCPRRPSILGHLHLRMVALREHKPGIVGPASRPLLDDVEGDAVLLLSRPEEGLTSAGPVRGRGAVGLRRQVWRGGEHGHGRAAPGLLLELLGHGAQAQHPHHVAGDRRGNRDH
mmetsp:Transcript_18980/g.57118  ORF Transcript_18980/g.57118 Transcript_18980/m.57118 type:complete len:221 (+) Transcript_18980:245-907(+)